MISGQRERLLQVECLQICKQAIYWGVFLGVTPLEERGKKDVVEGEDGLHCKFNESHISGVGKDNPSCPELS